MKPLRWILMILAALFVLAGIVAVSFLLSGGFPGQKVIEEQGKLNAAATETVKSLSARFGDEVRILALEQHRVDDHDLIGAMFPEFPRGKIGCIIVAYAGSEGAVFVENQKLRIIHEESLEVFVARTNKVDPAIVAAFYLSLA